jgi:hypothetical protein
MLTVAAIYYSEDQNQPSCPFLMELDVPSEPTKQQVMDALRQQYFADYGGQCQDMTMDEVVVHPEDHYGDFRVDAGGSSTHLFATLPPGLADRLK